MALTIGSLTRDNIGSVRMHAGTITWDSSYAGSGGESLTPAMLGLHTIKSFQADPKDGYVFEYNYSTNKLLAYRSANAAGTISKPTFTVKNGTIGVNMTVGLTADATTADVVGGTGITTDRALTTTSPVGTPTFTGSGAAALVEVANGVNLSTVVCRFRAFGT